YTSTILLKNGKLSDLIGELQSLLNGTGEQSEGDFDAIASQVSRLAAEVRQLGWSRQITVLNGNDSQIGLTSLIMPAATLGALGYGYMWWKGLKFSDLMYVTKRSMTAAILNLHTHLESVTEAIANTKKHLTKRVQNLDDKLLEQKEISKSILENVGDTKGSIEELYVTVTELQSALTGLVSSASTCIGVGQICNLSYFSLLQDYKLGSISEKQDVSNLGVFYLVNFVEGKQVEMPQQTKLKLTGNPRGRL
ncbi:PREDICTED: unknown, partial [Prunus dulcis]